MYVFNIFKIIESPLNAKIKSVIRFLTVWNKSAIDIHRQVCKVYGPDAMSERNMQKWAWEFKNGSENVHDNTHSGRSSVVSNDLISVIDTKIQDDRIFAITKLSLEIRQVSRSVIYKTVSENLNFLMLCSWWVQKLLPIKTKDLNVH